MRLFYGVINFSNSLSGREMKKFLFAVCCMAMIISIAACAGKKVEKSAPELAEEGSGYFEKGDYVKAMASYNRLKDWYPYSPYAREAQLRVADSHYYLEEYEEAIFGYQQYEQLYPNDPEIPYVIYQVGLCHYERLRSVDRTQVPARNALETFERLRSRFPASEYAEKVTPMIEKCLENMAGHEFYVGRFYFRAGHYRAAMNRFQKVIHHYPDHLEIQKEASDYLKLAENRLVEQDETPDGPEVGRPLERPFGADAFTSPSPDPAPEPVPPSPLP